MLKKIIFTILITLTILQQQSHSMKKSKQNNIDIDIQMAEYRKKRQEQYEKKEQQEQEKQRLEEQQKQEGILQKEKQREKEYGSAFQATKISNLFNDNQNNIKSNYQNIEKPLLDFLNKLKFLHIKDEINDLHTIILNNLYDYIIFTNNAPLKISAQNYFYEILENIKPQQEELRLLFNEIIFSEMNSEFLKKKTIPKKEDDNSNNYQDIDYDDYGFSFDDNDYSDDDAD
jgi:hypothetical protein